MVSLMVLLLAVAPQTGDLPGILLERRLAAELAAEPGDTVMARALSGAGQERPFLVEGIYERAADPNRISRNELEVRFHLPDLEELLGLDDRVDRFAIELREGADVRSAGEWIEGLAYGTRVIATTDLTDEASTTFQVVSRFHDAIGLITMLASGIFLLCLMVIRVDERRSDVRMLRLVGISRRTVFGAIVIEAVSISAVAAGLGAVIGALMTAVVNAYYASYYDTTLRFALLDAQVIWTAIGTGVVLGVVAGVLAALRVVALSPQRLGER